MPQCVLSATVSRVRTVAVPPPDAELVSAFAGGDPEAFAEIVRRHGPMVLGVCRKITRHAHDAEDAAQAAFLVLARRAGTIRAAGLASWLFGVAVNTSREVRRRSGRHASTGDVPEVGRVDPDPDFDTRAVVAEELACLPDRYRELVVRCDLEGESQAAVARRVGLPVGTVYSRLSTARSLLAGRLARRGIAAGLGLLAFPRTAFAFPDCPSKRVTELTEAVMRIGTRWKWAVAAVLTAGVALSAAERPRAEPAPMPRDADGSKLTVLCGSHIKYLSPGGTVLGRVTAGDVNRAGADVPSTSFTISLTKDKGLTSDLEELFMPHGRPAPDGRIPFMTRKGLYLHTPGGTAEPVKDAAGRTLYPAGDGPAIVAWSPDGKTALAGTTWAGGYFDRPRSEHAVIDLAAGATTPLKLPADHRAHGWSPCGSWVLTIRDVPEWTIGNGWRVSTSSLCKVSADGKTVTPLTGSERVVGAALSPDGKTAAVLTHTWKKVGPPMGYEHGFELLTIDIAGGGRKTLVREPGGAGADGKMHTFQTSDVVWSPDGTRVAFAVNHSECVPAKGIEWSGDWQLKTIAADGTDAKTVFTVDRKPDGKRWVPYMLVDWR